MRCNISRVTNWLRRIGVLLAVVAVAVAAIYIPAFASIEEVSGIPIVAIANVRIASAVGCSHIKGMTPAPISGDPAGLTPPPPNKPVRGNQQVHPILTSSCALRC